MTRHEPGLRSGLEPENEHVDPRRLAALVPRGGAQRHPTAAADGVCCGLPEPHRHDDPDHVTGQLPTEWKTTP